MMALRKSTIGAGRQRRHWAIAPARRLNGITRSRSTPIICLPNKRWRELLTSQHQPKCSIKSLPEAQSFREFFLLGFAAVPYLFQPSRKAKKLPGREYAKN